MKHLLIIAALFLLSSCDALKIADLVAPDSVNVLHEVQEGDFTYIGAAWSLPQPSELR